MNKSKQLILWFNQTGIEDVAYVGGKNASLGEMYRNLTKKGINVPNGFAITAFAYQDVLIKAGVEDDIKNALKGLDTSDIKNLSDRGAKVRKIIRNCEFPEDLKIAIKKAYAKMCKEYGKDTDVAVRSSATAEDLPDASFAGQQETYLNIRGEQDLIDACKNCFASLFTNRAISYREDKGFDHFKVYLSIGVQKMVRSDLSCSGVMFSIDTESGFKNAVFITSAYGLGENVVQGAVNPDEYYVFKPTLKKGFRPIIQKVVGSKEIKMIYSDNPAKPTKNVPVAEEERKKFVLDEDDILLLAKWACVIEDHYSKKAGYFKPMDMEWAKDGITNQIFIVQARPETVQSQKDLNVLETYKLMEKGKVITTGNSVGEKIGQGPAHVIKDVKDIAKFKKGEVLVTEMTDPDWEPIMKIASAIVANRGGRTCFTGDTKVLTNQGFMTCEDVFNDYQGLSVPSLNRDTLKVEWKPIIAAMKKQTEVIEIETSQTGRMKGNKLRLTPDHKMLTFNNRELASTEIRDILGENNMILLAQSLPQLTESTEKDKKLAYLLGGIMTDGHIYLSGRHGEVQFIQKPTKEKQEFIETMQQNMEAVFEKKFKTTVKKQSEGFIRGKQVKGNANAYRCYSKGIAIQMLKETKNVVQTLLLADKELSMHFLAGVIDGDGSFNHKSNRINIYCSKENLLQAIVISCLRNNIVPQVTINRNIYNVQIVEKIGEICRFTKRVKGNNNRKIQGTRFFSAKQLFNDILDDVNYDGDIKQRIGKNILIDNRKIRNLSEKVNNEDKIKLNKILDSDTRMQRVSLSGNLGKKDVYNITVADNHNYIVFTDRYTPVLVNNCHAAIISRELGIPCIVGTTDGTTAIKNNKKMTVSCAEGEVGKVYDKILKFRIEKTDLKQLPKTRTKIMMNVGNPDQAFTTSFIPNSGVGLAREEFIINSYIKVHPRALMDFDNLKDKELKQQIEAITQGYKDKTQFFIDQLARGVSMIASAFYPNDVIVRMSDFKTNEYANLIGGHLYEPKEDNPMIGWRGASRYYKPGYRDAFALECKAMKKVREEMGLTNVKLMIPFCRTVEEGKKVLKEMEKQDLKRGKNGLEVYVMCEIPSNVILADEFSKIFDGFSIGSNDLTQLTLGLDRDSEIVSDIYDERNAAVKEMISMVIKKAKANKRKIGICGQAPSDYPEFAQFLVECGIDSISLNPDTVVKTTLKIAEKEKKLGIKVK